MLSIFPNLYNFSALAPFIIRLFLGFFLLKTAYVNYKFIRSSGASFVSMSVIPFILPLIGGVFFILGFLIQPTALVFALICLYLIIYQKRLMLGIPGAAFDFNLPSGGFSRPLCFWDRASGQLTFRCKNVNIVRNQRMRP